ncbi:MAG: hypothetical protein ACRCWW_17950 [Scandinavium sp.]|uniref:hypothetical protein n=1 Tax=Scandinavium sp. TaxID=2830653 RepID=UPI003F3AF669
MKSSDALLHNQALNEAAIACLSLEAVTAEERLYALAILLSATDKLADSEESRRKILSMPARLAEHAQSGELSTGFQNVVTVDVLRKSLIQVCGTMVAEWKQLPESKRKNSWPMQVSLLRLDKVQKDDTVQHELDAIWQTKGQKAFEKMPWSISHYLTFRIQQGQFTAHSARAISDSFLDLVADYYQLRTLFSLWMQDGSELAESDVVSIMALFENWRTDEQADRGRPLDISLFADNAVLAACSLLPGGAAL